MSKVPKPRKPGQSGGDMFNRTNRATHASARVTQKAKKDGCLSCGVVAVLTLGLGTIAAVSSAYGAYSLFVLASR